MRPEIASASRELESTARDDLFGTSEPLYAGCVVDLPEPISAILVREEPPPKNLIEGLLPAGEFGLLVGEDGAFKTTLALTLCGAIASGEGVFGRVATGGRVLIVSEEDAAWVLRNRLEAIANGQAWDRGQTLLRTELIARRDCWLDDPEWQSHLEWLVDVNGYRLVVFDPYAELTRGAENSNDDSKVYIRFFRRLTDLGATVLVVHHLGKAAEGRNRRDRIRGASALRSASRFVLALGRARSRLVLECLKMSRTAPFPPLQIEVTIAESPRSPMEWHSARIVTAGDGSAVRIEAEMVILQAIADEPGIKAGRLKKIVGQRGVGPVDFSRAKTRLEEEGYVSIEAGSRGAKLHALAQPGRERLARNPDATRQVETHAGHAASPGVVRIPAQMPSQPNQVITRHPSFLEDAGVHGSVARREAATELER